MVFYAILIFFTFQQTCNVDQIDAMSVNFPSFHLSGFSQCSLMSIIYIFQVSVFLLRVCMYFNGHGDLPVAGISDWGVVNGRKASTCI